jgi:hypothetical protein
MENISNTEGDCGPGFLENVARLGRYVINGFNNWARMIDENGRAGPGAGNKFVQGVMDTTPSLQPVPSTIEHLDRETPKIN